MCRKCSAETPLAVARGAGGGRQALSVSDLEVSLQTGSGLKCRQARRWWPQHGESWSTCQQPRPCPKSSQTARAFVMKDMSCQRGALAIRDVVPIGEHAGYVGPEKTEHTCCS